MSLWDILLGRSIDLIVLEDNQATIKIIRNGYSSKLRHVNRVHKINLSSVYERFEDDNVDIVYCNTDFQAADIFTKALAPNKWDHALKLLGMDTTLPSVTNTKVVVADTRVDDAPEEGGQEFQADDKLETSWRQAGDKLETNWRQAGDKPETSWRQAGDKPETHKKNFLLQ